jgi:short-subunit dehydrogenase
MAETESESDLVGSDLLGNSSKIADKESLGESQRHTSGKSPSPVEITRRTPNADGSRPLAVVTGASSGIGLELAKLFASDGYDLFIASGSDLIQDAVEELSEYGGSVEALQINLATEGGPSELWQAVTATGREVDAIALNAGVGVGGDFATETSLEEEINIVNLNCRSTVILAKHAAQQMEQRGAGKILITASIAGTMPTPNETVYGASKAFDLSFANGLHYELKDRGITVTALMPGATDTNFFHRAHLDNTKVGSEGKKENTAAEVARQGYEALNKGERNVVAASLTTKLQGRIASFVPDDMLASMHGKMTAKKTA